MLSLGHYDLNYQGQHSIPLDSQFQYGRAASYPQSSLTHVQHHSSTDAASAANLPLTPPGSPDDEEQSPLVISDSPQKTPRKQSFPAAGNGDDASGCLMGQLTLCSSLSSQSRFIADVTVNAESCNEQSRNGPFPYAASLNSATATAFAVAPIDLDGSTSAANLFYNNTGALARSPSVYSCVSSRRSRNDKKPMLDVMKDEKYFERRRRNNAAAKKSRDARKNREDEIAARAAFLEKENAILRAQVATLRDEAQNLRLLLLQKQERQLAVQMEMSSSISSFAPN